MNIPIICTSSKKSGVTIIIRAHHALLKNFDQIRQAVFHYSLMLELYFALLQNYINNNHIIYYIIGLLLTIL